MSAKSDLDRLVVAQNNDGVLCAIKCRAYSCDDEPNYCDTDNNRPKLFKEMSDPSTSLSICTTSPRGKRDSIGKSPAAYCGTNPQSVSYASYNLKGNFDVLVGGVKGSSASLEESWKNIYGTLLTSQAVANKPITIRNPNKAILTIHCPSTKVLIANDVACRLFGFGQDHLVGRRLGELMASGGRHFVNGPSVADRTFADATDELVPISGKVIEILDAAGEIVPVSLWIQPLSSTQMDVSSSASSSKEEPGKCDRWLAVLEPVERFSASCILGPQGRIFSSDNQVADLFGFNSANELLGLNITDLVPALILPVSKHNIDLFKQNLTGRFRGGTSFPVTVKVVPEIDKESGDILKYNATFHVYTTISGLITILPDGRIRSFNSNFVSTLFGYRQEQLIDKPIETIIPKFYCETMPIDDGFYLSPSYDDLPTECANGYKLNNICAAYRKTSCSEANSSCSSQSDLFTSPQRLSLTPKISPFMAHSFCSTPRALFGKDVKPLSLDESSQHPINEGSFWGFGKHRDNSLIAIGYKIKHVLFKDGTMLYCIWIVRDPESQLSPHFVLGSRRGSDITTGTQTPTPDLLVAHKPPLDVEKLEHQFDIESETSDYARGDYSKYFHTLQQIGKGSFGCVKMALRKLDNLLVVTKFINKEAVLPDSWVLDKKLGRVPIEISLLTTLKHANIVQVLAVYQNEKYFQLVMEKHGEGMDLFEFIEHEPRMDEYLTSYIFRQVVSAVSFLHGQKILHRDLKDENVIIDDKFWCKVIDFGSAAFMQPNKLFSTFCGTMDYCSPEVLLGNRYAGPELEMWSLGILLYTLVFYENPFHNVEETIAAELEPPWEVSEGLFTLLSWLLHPSPVYRATVKEVERHWWVNLPVDISRYRFSDVILPKGDTESSLPTPLLKVADLKLAESSLCPMELTKSASSPANHTV